MSEQLLKVLAGLAQLFAAPLFQIGQTSVSVSSIFQLVFSLLIVVLIIRWLKLLLSRKLLVKFKIDANNREAIATIISYSTGTLGLLIVLQNAGFNLASIAVLAGGLGVGIGLGLQDITINFVSGMTLLLTRKLRVGDFIEFDGMAGYIEEVALQSTIIRTRDGGDVVVPNRHLIENRVINWSYDSYTARLHVPVSVAYGSDLVIVTEALLSSAYAEPSVLADPPPQVLFLRFGDSALELELRVWVNRIDLDPDIKSALNFAIEHALKQHGVQIPFPQMDLWLRNPEDLSQGIHFTKQAIDSTAVVHTSTKPAHSHASSKHIPLKTLLQQVSYFQNWTDLQLRQLIEIGYRQRLKASEVLFNEGDAGNAFYIILSGSVEVVLEKLNKQLSILKPGQFFGELSLMLGIPRTATVRALESTNLFVISNKGFEKLLTNHPDLYEVIVHELSKHQEELAQRKEQLRALGLIDVAEDDKNLMIWVRNRLKRLFSM